MDIYDLKPEAPAEYRGLWQPIRTNVPGMEISELFPRQAKMADKFSIVRSLHHDTGDHFAGAHYMLTSRGGASGADTTGKYPSIGSIATKLLGPRRPGMPAYVAVPYAVEHRHSARLLRRQLPGHGPQPVRDQRRPQQRRLQGRQHPTGRRHDASTAWKTAADCSTHFDRLRRDVDRSGTMESMDRFERSAYEMVVGGAAREAFDLSQEDAATRDRYGRNSWGQSTLLARRLVEAGTTFVTVHLGGWDHHWDLKTGMENYLPQVDMLVSALFTDLERSRAARQDDGRAMRRVQPHAADEQRRQRRPAGQHGHARPRPLGQRHVLLHRRRRHPGRPGRRLDQPPGRSAASTARSNRATSTPRCTTSGHRPEHPAS